jgi:hypothetical protein
MNCQQDCYNCPFVIDPNDSQRYVCIKCGKEYSFRRFDALSLLMLVLAALLIMVLFSSRSPDRSRQQPTTHNFHKNTAVKERLSVLEARATHELGAEIADTTL